MAEFDINFGHPSFIIELGNKMIFVATSEGTVLYLRRDDSHMTEEGSFKTIKTVKLSDARLELAFLPTSGAKFAYVSTKGSIKPSSLIKICL